MIGDTAAAFLLSPLLLRPDLREALFSLDTVYSNRMLLRNTDSLSFSLQILKAHSRIITAATNQEATTTVKRSQPELDQEYGSSDDELFSSSITSVELLPLNIRFASTLISNY